MLLIRITTYLLAIVVALYISPLNACVGKTLHIGIIDSPNEQLLAELASQLITERTGTTVKVETFKGQQELYNSVKKGQIGLLIENTDRGMDMIGKPRGASGKAAFETVKAEYRKSLNLIWLEPFGTVQGGGAQMYAPVISSEILGNLPALPKLLQKLSGITSDSGYQRLLKAKGTDKPKKIAKDFLKSKKLI
jgi:glycine betaine/choline ABC-type transport system substrate-binding protein